MLYAVRYALYASIVIFSKDEKSKFDFISTFEFILLLLLTFTSSIVSFLFLPVLLVKWLPGYKSFFLSNYFGVFLYFFSSALSFYFIYYFCCKRKNKTLFEGLFIKFVSNKIYLFSFAVGILMPLLTLPILFKFAPKQFYAMDLLKEQGGLLYLFISATFAPLFEEIFYRGFLFPFFQSKINSFWGIVIVSILFGFSHVMNIGTAYVLLFLFIFYGLVLTLVRYFTNSLIPSVIVHLVHNIFLLGGFFVFGGKS